MNHWMSNGRKSQEMRLRAYRKDLAGTCEVEGRRETTCLSVAFTKTLAIFTSGTCLDTSMLLKVNDADKSSSVGLHSEVFF